MIKKYTNYITENPTNENANIDFENLEFLEFKKLFSNIEHRDDRWYTRVKFDNGYGMIIEVIQKNPPYKIYTWEYYIFKPNSDDVWKQDLNISRNEVEKIFNKVQSLSPLKQIFDEIDPLGEEEWGENE
jgi:hypothetical protein